MTMTSGAATTLLGNIAGGRPMGHDGAAADALIAVPVGLFQSLMAQSALGSSFGQVGQQQGGWYGGPVAGPIGHPYGTVQGSPYGNAFGSPYAATRPHDLVAVPAHLFHSLIAQQQGGGYGIGAAGHVAPFQVIPGGYGYR